MKNLTDEQIIIALECCAKQISNCSQCSYRFNEDDKFDCEEALGRDTIDLINRKNAKIEELKTEIERLKAENKSIRYCYEQEKSYNDTLAESCEKNCKHFNMTTKSKAIKDFAERLKRTSIGLEIGDDKKLKMTVVSTVAIDNLVKEMTEEENDV